MAIPTVHPQTEDYWGHVNPIGPRSCYDEGKRCAETLFFDYWRQHKLASRSRASSTPMGRACIPNDGRVVSNFIVQALLGHDITIYGDGTQTRSFCYVDDLIDGLMRLMKATPEPSPGPINIGNPTSSRSAKLASRSSSLPVRAPRLCTGHGRKMTRASGGPTFPRHRKFWDGSPRTPLAQGLKKTIDYFEALLKEPGMRQRLAEQQT